MRRPWLPGGLLLLTACGPLPHPFEHDAPNPLLDDHRAMAPLTVRPVAELPGLAEDLARALQAEEIAASTEDGGSAGRLLLTGAVEQGALRWRVAGADGKPLVEASQPLPAGKVDAATRPGIARQGAALLSRALRGEDSGLSDLEARPHVALRPVKVPPSVDADSLTGAMRQALAQRGLTVTDDAPRVVVEGHMRVSPGSGGQDVVELDWVVRDAAGRELGTVSQGSPVAHAQTIGNLGALGHDIANAGAEGVAEVIRQRLPAR